MTCISLSALSKEFTSFTHVCFSTRPSMTKQRGSAETNSMRCSSLILRKRYATAENAKEKCNMHKIRKVFLCVY